LKKLDEVRARGRKRVMVGWRKTYIVLMYGGLRNSH
jgi:hypothetical protein